MKAVCRRAKRAWRVCVQSEATGSKPVYCAYHGRAGEEKHNAGNERWE